MTTEIPVDKLAKVYVKIRDRKSELKAAFDEEYSKLNAQQEKISRALLDYCKANNLNSFNTDAGTVTRKTTVKYWTNDWESMYKFVIEHEVPEFFTKQLHQGNVKTFLAENPDVLPKGLNADTEYVVSVTRPKKH